LHPHFPEDFSIKHHKHRISSIFPEDFAMKHQKHSNFFHQKSPTCHFSGEFSHLFPPFCGSKNGVIFLMPGQGGGGSGHQTGQWLTRSPGAAVAKMVGSWKLDMVGYGLYDLVIHTI